MVPTYLFYAIFGLWLLIITILLIRTMVHYNRLTSNVSKKDLISALNHLISVSTQNTEDIKSVFETLSREINQNKEHFQKLGFKRYNPFTDTGGDQSFTAAFLDDNGNGIMISSLHSRENTRLYAKKVENGKVTSQALSREEQEVINEALK
ncbi:MAG: hypothetical protein UW68_C0007G0010 [Candidatus Collierbacteria bacterium GW2011_GWB1_44_6]|uniref:DUF4446 domain-containing protein n=1 Tax=Candidatus Collierbacteria bacterium GW2011_GWB1_44_6 TaxID=1618384 RepID=A0A0G1JQ49_9BACT|nr:MAG: hypothetical protein UW68_C0007G0010 [Candidatus Collierbacteria bacterium GW2011_GWB1_44_6]